MKKLLTLTLLALSFSVFAQERVALVVGNADYQISPLNNAINDAEDIAAALSNLNFDVTKTTNVGISVIKLKDVWEDLIKLEPNLTKFDPDLTKC